ncbi:hypothetical protein FOL47_001033 [Perkinsus chesapeaki]|uniref:Uncharacterized protein n=1 Tax=Perkinsus chesapeaki TaxID=330153 RepID=A0A7J6KVI0_PERCH|nr:hypothetical protein FOL47_001033 [Perkinsus chesapeaki]
MDYLFFRPRTLESTSGWQAVPGPVVGHRSIHADELPISSAGGVFHFLDFSGSRNLLHYFPVNNLWTVGDIFVFSRLRDWVNVYWCRGVKGEVCRIAAPRKYTGLRLIQGNIVVVSNSDVMFESAHDSDTDSLDSSSLRTLVYRLDFSVSEDAPTWNIVWRLDFEVGEFDCNFVSSGGRGLPVPQLIFTPEPVEESVILGRLGNSDDSFEQEIYLPNNGFVIQGICFLYDTYACAFCVADGNLVGMVVDLFTEGLMIMTPVYDSHPLVDLHIYDLVLDDDSILLCVNTAEAPPDDLRPFYVRYFKIRSGIP